MSDDFEQTCPNCGTQNRADAKHCRKCGAALTPEQPALVGAVAQAASSAQLKQDISEITDPLIRMGPAFVSDAIGASIARILTDVGPRQAEVLRRCAIPRWFDENVLALLRERADGNDRILDLLNSYSFVRPLDDRRYAYHDEVRAVLLADWQAERPAELRSWNERLAAYFRARATLVMPARTLPKSPAQTTISVALGGEWDLYQREALYHTLLVDQQAGMQMLDEAFNQAEVAHRLGDAEALLQITRTMALDDQNRLWLRYLRARLDRAALQLDPAAAQLESLLALPKLDGLLEARARQALGEIYAETARWVQATELYHRARDYYTRSGRARDVAEIWRLLGESYQALGTSIGGWHVPAYPQSRFWRWLGELWTLLLALPFHVLGFFLRSSTTLLPRPRYLASYRNWTLVWLLRTAAACYERSRAAFDQLGDDTGMLQTGRQLADITRMFGYPDAALQRITKIKTQPAAQDPYQRAWLDWVVAAALIDKGAIDQAQGLLQEQRDRFREVGDVRREVAAMTLQARAAAQGSDYAAALDMCRACLLRCRTLNYVAARELVLYDLRVLRRQVGPGALSQEISVILDAEPVKRYVARFPRSQLPLLRILSIIALPLALLVIAIVAPRESIAQIANLASLQLTVDFGRGLLALALLLLIYSGVYALVAVAVIAFVPLGDLDREQPDYFVTDTDGISRYDFRGFEAQRMRWDEIGRWLRIERRLWARPVSLVSGAFLEHRSGEDLRIDGITGWFLSLQEDIDRHMRAARSTVRAENYGFVVIRSPGGVSALLGFALLGLFIFSQNTWTQWLTRLLPAEAYAVLSMLAFSGLLILIPTAYWLALNPLSFRRELGIRDYYPFAAAVIGALMVVVGVFSLVPRVPPLNFGLVITGALVLGYALAVIAAATNRVLRLAIVGLLLLLGLAYVGGAALPIFHMIVSRAGADRAVLSATSAIRESSAADSINAGVQILNDADASPVAKAQAYANAGRALYAVGQWKNAIEAYSRALVVYTQLADTPEQQQALAVLHYNRYKAIRDSGGSGWNDDLNTACSLVPDVGPDCDH